MRGIVSRTQNEAHPGVVARQESTPAVRAELEGLAAGYIRLAEQAERNSHIDVFYETPPAKTGDPELKC